MAAPAIFLSFSAATRSASTTIGPRDVFIRRAVGFMSASSAAPTRPRVLPLSTRWMETISASWNSSSFETRVGADFGRPLRRQILAPGDHLHTEGVTNLCHRTADVAETQDTERPPSHVVTDRLLPSAAAQRRVLGNEIAGTAQDKCPSEFDRRRRGVARMNDLHASLFCSLEIDRGVPGRRRGDQAELG